MANTVYDPLTGGVLPTEQVVDPIANPIEEQAIVGPSVKRVVGNIAEGVGQVYEDVTGDDEGQGGLEEYGEDLARVNASPIQSLGDIPENPGRFVSEQVTEQGAQLVGTGIGALVGGALGQLVAGSAGRRAGRIIGGAAPAVIQSYGGIREHTDDVQDAAAAAIASGAIERLTGLERTAGRLIDGSKLLSSSGNMVSRAARQAAESVATEVPTEIVQTAIERAGGDQPITGPQALHQYAMSAAAATAGAAPIGGVMGAVTPRTQEPADESGDDPGNEQTQGALPAPAGGPAGGTDQAADTSQPGETVQPAAQTPARSYTQWAAMVSDGWIQQASQSMNTPLREAAADLRVAKNNSLDGATREQAAERAADIVRQVRGDGLSQQPPDLRDQGPLEAAMRRAGMHDASMDRAEPEPEPDQPDQPEGVVGQQPIEGERVSADGGPRSEADIEAEAAAKIAAMELTAEQAAQAQERLRTMGYASTVEDHPNGMKSVKVTLPARDSAGNAAERIGAQQPQLPGEPGQQAAGEQGQQRQLPRRDEPAADDQGQQAQTADTGGATVSEPENQATNDSLQIMRDMGATSGDQAFTADAPVGPIRANTPMRILAGGDNGTLTVQDTNSGDTTTLSGAEISQARDSGVTFTPEDTTATSDQSGQTVQPRNPTLAPVPAGAITVRDVPGTGAGTAGSVVTVAPTGDTIIADDYSTPQERADALAQAQAEAQQQLDQYGATQVNVDADTTPAAPTGAADTEVEAGPTLNARYIRGDLSTEDYLNARGVDSEAYTQAKVGGQIKPESTQYEQAMDAAIQYAEDQRDSIKQPSKQTAGAMKLYRKRRSKWVQAADTLRRLKKKNENPFQSDLVDAQALPASIRQRFQSKIDGAGPGEQARAERERKEREAVVRYADERIAAGEPAETRQTQPDTGEWTASPDMADQYDRDVAGIDGVQSASVTEEDAGVWQPAINYVDGQMMLDTQPTREQAQQSVDSELAQPDGADTTTPAQPQQPEADEQPGADSPYDAPNGSSRHPTFRKTAVLIAEIKAIAARTDIDNAPDDSEAATIMQVLSRRLGEAQMDTLNAELDRISVGPATDEQPDTSQTDQPSAQSASEWWRQRTPSQRDAMMRDAGIADVPGDTLWLMVGSLSQHQIESALQNRGAIPTPSEQAAEDKQQRRQVERELFAELATIDAITTIVDSPQFIQQAHDIVRAHIETQAETATANGDSERAAALRGALPDRNDFAFYRALQEHAQKAVQKANAERGKEPDVRNEALGKALAADGLAAGTDDAEAFTRGFDHAVAKRTRSTLPQSPERAAAMAQRGYEAGNRWVQTDAGANYATGGKRRNKLQNTGADLQRWFDKQMSAAGNADTEGKQRKKLLAATSRAKLFPIEDNPDATPGTAAFIEKLRNTMATFSEVMEPRNTQHFGYTPTGRDAVMKSRLRTDAIESIAREYADSVMMVRNALLGSASVWDASRRLNNAIVGNAEVRDSYNDTLNAIERDGGLTLYSKQVDTTDQYNLTWGEWSALTREADRIDALTEAADMLIGRHQKGSWGQFLPGGGTLAQFGQNQDTVTRQGQSSRAKPMKRPKYKSVERTGMPDRRSGRDVTPQQMKDTFAFADVGFGEWVGATRDQEHLNNAYDAFYDLAEFLGLPTEAMGFFGQLHFTIGALGNGRHAAHYSPNQPHPAGGTVPVINVTNTHGDGSVAHEWAHALDFFLSDTPAGRAEMKAGYDMLKKNFAIDEDKAQDMLRTFYKGHAQIVTRGRKFKKRKDNSDNIEEGARYYMNRAATTHYKVEADKLGADYWGNDLELWARAFESWVADELPGVSDYLVSKAWVSDGAVTKPPFRGTPYPQSDERARFNQMFRAFADKLRSTAGTIDTDATTLADMRAAQAQARHETIERAKDYWLNQIEQDAEQAREQRQQRTQAAADQAERERQAQDQAAAERAQRELNERGDTERTHTSTVDEPQLADLGRMSDDEIDALVDEAAAQVHEGNQETPDAPTPGETTVLSGDGSADTQGNPEPQGPVQQGAEKGETVSKLSKEFAKHGINSVDGALRGLNELFGGNSLRSFPGGVDPDTYAKAKPHFETMWAEAKAAGRSLTELARLIIDTWGDGVAPYVKYWMKERRRATMGAGDTEPTDATDTDGGNSQEPLAAVAAESAREPDGERDAGRGSAGRGGSDASGNGRAETGGTDGGSSLAGGEGLLRDAAGESGRRGDDTRELGEQVAPPNPEPTRDSPEAIPNGNSQPPGRANTPALSGTNPGNYHITDADEIGTGTRGQRIDANIAAIETVKRLQAEGRFATPEEQATMVKYVGWGGLKRVFQIDDKSTTQDRRANERLRALLTDEEYAAAQRSVLDAHYTSADVVRGLYSVANFMGVNSGRVLEPAVGTGNFIGLMPTDMVTGSRVDAVELDDMSAAIARFVYPESQIVHKAYQDANLPYAGYDLVIGNPPFGDRPITDNNKKRKEISGFTIHNYFLAKSAMHMKPGGVMGVVVTNRFLDKPHSKGRDYLADNLQFLGAIRLPNTAFAGNAGTEVTTDLVFFRKPVEHGEAEQSPAWTNVVTFENADGEQVKANEYFAERPHLMLGKPSMAGTMYGSGAEFTLQAPAGLNISQAIADILQSEDFAGLRDVASSRPDQAADVTATAYQPNLEDVNIGGFVLHDGNVLQRLDDDQDGNPVYRKLTANTQWTPKQELGAKRLARIRGMLELRDAAYDLMTAERMDAPNIEDKRQTLNKLYDAFVRQHGYINDNANASLFREDVRIEFGLEKDYRAAISAKRAKTLGAEPRKATAKKSSLLVTRVNYPRQTVESVGNAIDGYVVSMQEHGHVDLAYIARLYGQPESAVIDELSAGDKPYIYQDPVTQDWLAHDEYLSGNVKKKLREAEGLEGYDKNVASLREVLPADIPADNISANFGATWIPADVYEMFAEEIGISRPSVAVSKHVGLVALADKGRVNTSGEYAKYSGGDNNQAEVFNRLASGKQLVVRVTDSVTKKSFVDQQKTDELRQAAEEISAYFNDWIMAEPSRATQLTHRYNETMNTTIERRYDGDMLRLVGVNPDVELRDTQLSAAWRMVQSQRTLLDHVVGAGKTYTVIAGIMERRRMGLTNKPLVVVPNHKVGDWASDFIKLYPGANVLAATNKDFTKKNRRRLFARMAAGDYDAIIIGHSSFNFIPMLAENEVQFMQQQVALLEQAAETLGEDANDAGTRRTVRNLENSKAKLEERIKKLLDEPRDTVATIEEMGIDSITVDESQEFKNLMISTSMTNIAGMGNLAGSKKAMALFMRLRQIQKGGGSTYFATGTPISNTMTEMYTVLRYMAYEQLEARDLSAFDAWARTHASVEERVEMGAGGKFKQRRVMASFQNMPELMQMYNQFADVVTMGDLKRQYAEQIARQNKERGTNEPVEFPVPDVVNGGRVLNLAEPNPLQEEYSEYLRARAEALQEAGNDIDPSVDNMLLVITDSRKMSMDIRMVDPDGTDYDNNKTSRSAREIKRLYDKWHAEKGAQLVFSDLGTPLAYASNNAGKTIKDMIDLLPNDQQKRVKQMTDDMAPFDAGDLIVERMRQLIEQADGLDATLEKINKYLDEDVRDDFATLQTTRTGFSVYDDLRSKLVDMGVPDNEIAFIHDYNTNKQKSELFDLVNTGQVRVLIGSTAKMGAGTNVQERLVGLHHLDAPWRPSDVEQREGRVIRQGNVLYVADPDNFKVEIIAYSTERTLDSMMWQTLARKGEMLGAFRNATAREIEDVYDDGANFADFMAESTGNPVFKEQAQFKIEVKDLKSKRRRVQAQRSGAERTTRWAPDAIKSARENADKLRAYADKMAAADGSAIKRPDGDVIKADYANAKSAAQAAYRKSVDTYEQKIEEYNTALAQWKKAPESERGAQPSKPTNKPSAPTPYQIAKQSNEAKFYVDMAGEIADAAESNRAYSQQYEIAGVPIEVNYTPPKTPDIKEPLKGGFVTITFGEADDFEVASTSLSRRLIEHSRPDTAEQDLRNSAQGKEKAAERWQRELEEAQATLDKLQFDQQERLEEVEQRLANAGKEIEAIEAEMRAKAQESSNRYMGGKDHLKFSRAGNSTPAGMRVADLRAALHDAFGPGIRRMEQNGALHLVQSDSELPPEAQGAGARGLVIVDDGGQGRVYMVADRLSADNVQGVFLHEVGVHYGMRDMLGEQAFSDVLDRMAAMRTVGNAQVKAAYNRVPKDTPNSQRDEEALGYLAEHARSLPLVKRLIAKLRAFLFRKFGLGGDQLTDDAIVEMAKAAAGKTVRSDTPADMTEAGTHWTQPMYSVQAAADADDIPPDDEAKMEAMRRGGLLWSAATPKERMTRSVMEKWEAFKTNVLGRLREGLFDQFDPIRRAEGDVAPEQSAYLSARLSTGASSTMYASMLYGAPEWQNGIIGKKEGTHGLLTLLEPVKGDMNEWLGWMVAKRAEYLAGQDRENNMRPADIHELTKGVTGEKLQRFEAVAKDFREFNTDLLRMARDAGLLTDAQVKTFAKDRYYIPFFRVDENDAEQDPGYAYTKQGLSHQQSGIKELTGGVQVLNDPLENVFSNMQRLVDASLKNQALRQTVENTQDVLTLEPEGNRGDNDVIRVMDGGKTYYYRVSDPALLRSLVGLNEGPVPGLGVFRAAKQLLTASVTATPSFIIRNFVRDMTSAWMLDKNGFKFAVDSLRGGKDTLRSLRDKDNADIGLQSIMFAGASFVGGHAYGDDPASQSNALRRSLRAKGLTPEESNKFMDSLVDTPAKWWSKYRELGDAAENANRMAVYRSAENNNRTPMESVYEAKDLMDFSLHGNYMFMRVLSDMLPFFNARIQGLYKLGRAAQYDPKQIASRGMMVAGASLALAMANAGNEEYRKLPNWDKDLYWHLFLPGGAHVRIPKPFELGMLFGTIPELMYRLSTGRDDIEETFDALIRNFGQVLKLDPTPQLINPALEVYMNYDKFRDRPIESLGDLNKLPQARFSSYTSPTMVTMGQVLNMSPKKLEHLWNGYLGSLGTYALGIADWMVHQARGDVLPAKTWRSVPVLSDFVRFSDHPSRSTSYANQFYELLNEANKVYQTIQSYRETGRMQQAREMLQSNEGLLSVRAPLNSAQRQASDLRDRMEQVWSDETMTPEAKRKRLDNMQRMLNRLMQQAASLEEQIES